MSMKDWERKVLGEPGAADRVTDIENELRSTAELADLPGETIVPPNTPTRCSKT